MATIPNLTGKVCETLIRQEYWYEGKISENAHILFLKLQDGLWQRIFFDAGILFWKEVDTPDDWHTTPEDLYHYPQVDISAELGIVGQVIESVELKGKDNLSKIYFQFSNGLLLILQHSHTQDSMDIVITKANK